MPATKKTIVELEMQIEDLQQELRQLRHHALVGDVDLAARERETQLHRQRYQRLFEGLQEDYFFFGTDPEGTMIYVSPSVEDILGYPPETVIGQNWRDFVDVTRDENRDIEEYERRRFAGEPNPSYECLVNHADGGTCLIEIRDVAVRDDNGQVVSNEGICHDISKQRESELALRAARDELELRVADRTAELNRSKELYESVVDSQTDIVERWLPDGTRTFVNRACCHSEGKSREDLMGTPISRVADPATRSSVRREIASLTPSNPVSSMEVSLATGDGGDVRQHWIDHGLFDEAGNLVEIQSVGRDVTAQHRRAEADREAAVFRALLETLSPRERQVMDLVTAGKANKVIARILELSVKTVEKHRSSMMRKLQVQSVAELVRGVLAAEDRG